MSNGCHDLYLISKACGPTAIRGHDKNAQLKKEVAVAIAEVAQEEV